MLVFLLHGQALGYGENWSSWQSVKAVGGGPFSKLDGISFRYKEGNHSKENKYYYYQFKNSSSEKVKLKWWITYVNSKGENQVERLSKTIKPGSTAKGGQWFIGPPGQSLSAKGQLLADSGSSWKAGERHKSHKNVISSSTPNRWQPSPGYKFDSKKSSDLSVSWAPGSSHPNHPNIVAAKKAGYWNAKPGYRFSKPNSASLETYWKSGLSHPKVKNIYSAKKKGHWTAKPGYRWRVSGNLAAGVVWSPGKRHPEYRNVFAANEVGSWLPDPGYEWVNKSKSLSVRWVAGRSHSSYKNVKASKRTGYWDAQPGYRFNNPGTSDLSVSWYSNQRHPVYSKIYSSQRIGYWHPEKGYKFKNPGTGDLRVVSESANYLGEVKTRANSITIYYYDHSAEDGDRVTIYSNDRVVSGNIYLTNATKSTTINLRNGENRIVFKALNEGDKSPNTAAFKVKDSNGKTLTSNREWKLNAGKMAEIIVVKY